MWVLKVYIIRLERAIEHWSRDRQSHVNLTYIRMLAQNDPLEWTRRIGGLVSG